MQPSLCPLTDDELREAPPHVRAWYLRVLTLMHAHGAAWDLAVAAVAAADALAEEPHQVVNLYHLSQHS